MSLGERIKHLRIRRNLSQPDLARAIGVSASFITQIEQNKKGLSPENLLKLSRLFMVTTDYLLTGETQIEQVSEDLEVFYRDFQGLPPGDRDEIMQLVRMRLERLKREGRI